MYRTGLLVAGRIPGSNITRRLFSGAGLSDNWQGHGQHWAWGGAGKILKTARLGRWCIRITGFGGRDKGHNS
jgi:hypothetical protein